MGQAAIYLSYLLVSDYIFHIPHPCLLVLKLFQEHVTVEKTFVYII